MVLFIISVVFLVIAVAAVLYAVTRHRGIAAAKSEVAEAKKATKDDYDDSESHSLKKARHTLAYRQDQRIEGAVVACVAAIIGGIMMLFCVFYTQDAGNVVVLRNFGGSIAGVSKDAGLHTKAPWQTVITYDARNNLINFYGADTEYKADGGSYEGKQVSINDKSGASANVDIQVNYSLNPDAADDLYLNYGTQKSMTEKYVGNDLRSVTREVSGQFDTITMLTNRSQFTKAVQKALETKWNKIGLVVEQVSVQDVRYPSSITEAYSAAQAAEVNKQKAKNEQETAKVQAETKKIEAQGEADANAVLNNSLTDKVLTQKYIDALKNADNLTVVPNGSVPMIQTK